MSSVLTAEAQTMSLILQTFPHSCALHHHSPKPHLSVCSKTLKSLSLSATPHTSVSLSSSHIFLPLLQEDADPEPQLQNQKQEQEEDLNDEPILRFFKSRTSTQDPERESKITLQKNRRSSWRLAADDKSVDAVEVDFESKKEEVGSIYSNSSTVTDSVVREILQIARDLPQNSTFGEVLGSYVGRVNEKEYLEVLGLMGQEGLMMGCLYFFEWMGLQEPSLLTPRTSSILFPALGRAGMGDKLIILFRNLPAEKQFRDIHVYNAAISGLLCSGR